MSILWLGKPDCHDRAVVGGKAANLSRLAADYRVPPGFCLPATFHDRTRKNGPDPLPPAMLEELAEAYGRLQAGRVAVRSSAVDEDGAAASFAGQYETYLNVVGVEAVADAVARCRNSAYAARALEYRRRQGLPLDVGLAVLVQELVAADVSAVVFSANPVSGSREEVVINASWGLGESIVGGTVTPDVYVVGKRELTLMERRVSEKRRMTVAAPGGTRDVETPEFLRSRPALGEEQVIEMARLALELETRMGWPVDVECGYEAGQLYLLQCRPATALTQQALMKGEENGGDRD